MAQGTFNLGEKFDFLTKGEVHEVLRNWSTELLRGARHLRRNLAGTVAADGTVTLGAGQDEVGPSEGMVWAITRLTTTRLLAVPTVTTFANPGAGTEILLFPTAGQVWRIRTLSFVFTSSALVTNRTVVLVARDGSGNDYYRGGAPVQAASLVRSYSYLDGASSHSGGAAVNVSIPVGGLVVPGGHSFGTETDNLDAGDAFTAITMTYDINPGEGLNAYVNEVAPSQLLASGLVDTLPLDSHGIVLQHGDKLVVAGSGLLAGSSVVVTAQIKEVPHPMSWAL